MSMEYIRKHYGVPARYGQVVEFEGMRGMIVGCYDAWLRVRLDGSSHVIICHPTGEMRYLSKPEKASGGAS